jgi:hypothetical protein
MVGRAGGLLASRRLMDSVVFDNLCRGLGMVAQVVCSRASTKQRSSLSPIKKNALM